jgi:hypothetical protein
VYEKNSSGVLDLTPIPSIKADEMTDYIRGAHDQVKKDIEDNNATYKANFDSHKRKLTFEVGDSIRIVHTCDCFLIGVYSKLYERKIGPCEILQKINDNAH